MLTLRDDVAYETLRDSLRVQERVLFTTDAEGLFDVFLDNLPDEHRQHYTCHACRKFIERYGGLVVIDEEGKTQSAVWPDNVPEFFEQAVLAMRLIASKAKVASVFYSDKNVWGTPITGEWTHFAVKNPFVFQNRLKTPHQAMAEKAEDYKILCRSLAEFKMGSVEQVIALLQSEALYRSEKFLGVAEWFRDLHKVKNKNLIWRAVATAPTGWPHVRSTMIGTLLEDIEAGMDFNAVSARFKEKMHPLQYQRPQATPTEGNIKRAEEIFEKLDLASALRRRYARLEEIQTIWKPTERVEQAGGIFSHLRQNKQPAPMSVPSQKMTWTKFQETVLPLAEKIEFFVSNNRDSFTALMTAADPDAPPILKWDRPEQRNPFSWYLYHGGSRPEQWGLKYGYVNVTAVALQPNLWYGEFSSVGRGVVFILEGAKDTDHINACLFPEILKAELHEVRSTIEAHSRSAKREGEGSACGINLQAGQTWSHQFRVVINGNTFEYMLDRWD